MRKKDDFENVLAEELKADISARKISCKSDCEGGWPAPYASEACTVKEEEEGGFQASEQRW